mmetsp:Transcript_30687/g.80329  ORF Transcript_30687/g.80329 Transcript_30687/m.80329 type:complete len:457 (-) Transcript_30687:1498-2868(-)
MGGDDTVADDGGMIRKQEEDYTEQVDAAVPAAEEVAKGGDLVGAIEKLLPLEKKARIASDAKSTARLLEAIVQMCYDAKDYQALNENLLMLSKRRGALKMPITRMVQRGCLFVDELKGDKETRLKLIDTLRTVTAGKIHVEVERARLTKILSDIKEDEGDIAGAAEILHELQVETFGTMQRKEKVEFILEQMRLGLANNDIIRTGILSKKISTRYFKDPEVVELKLRYYDLMIKVALQEGRYLDICKYNREIFDTEKVQSADAATWQPILRDVVIFAVMAPYDNEQSDLIARIAIEKKLEEVPVYKTLLKKFSTAEIMPWRAVEAEFDAELKQSPHFQADEAGSKRHNDFRKMVVEHNIRTISKYYTRISTKRLAELLDLEEDQMEESLSRLVVKKTVYAKIDRPAGVITFKENHGAALVLQEWASANSSLMRQVDHAAHVIEKEMMTLRGGGGGR